MPDPDDDTGQAPDSSAGPADEQDGDGRAAADETPGAQAAAGQPRRARRQGIRRQRTRPQGSRQDGARQPARRSGVTLPEPMPFRPTPVNEAGVTKWVITQARQLVPGAVDEVLGHALDNMINARADQWVARVHAEFAEHEADLAYRRDQADSMVTRESRLQPPGTHAVIEAETARNVAAARLSGEHEKPGWAEPGHADPTLLAGRPRSAALYLAALLAAGAADIVAFYQVILLVLSTLPAYATAILVVAFTVLALLLAHYTGIMLRDRKAGAKWVPAFHVVFLCVVWFALGALAFWIRLRSNADTASTGLSLSVTGAAPSGAKTSGQGTVPGAALFAGLYAATGAVAMVGGYLSHNPLRAGFAQTAHAHRSAARRHARAVERTRQAEAEREFYVRQITAAHRVCDEAVAARHALAQELKQRARLELAAHLRDTSATDAFLTGDQRPYVYRPYRPSAS
jgi:hypothetical protein